MDVRTLYVPAANRQQWEGLTSRTLGLLIEAYKAREEHDGVPPKLIVLGESFGACLALRVARAAPTLIDRLVLINPATSFTQSLGGLTGLAASTRLLQLFPDPLYALAQKLFLPIMVRREALSEDADGLLSPVDYVPQDAADRLG